MDAELAHALTTYAAQWPQEVATVALFHSLLGDAENPFQRERLALTHHRKLGLWLQLGGHADGQRELSAAALREAEEESGLAGLTIAPEIFDLDRHRIPAHKTVPEHWHYDVRFVVRAGTDEAYTISEESLDLAWRDIADLAADPVADPSVRRMAEKWLAQG
jgi:8-oxo-dGTP pyrophosphatase MutT (NUDIX family)